MEIPEPFVSRRGPGPSSPYPPAGPSDAGPYHIDIVVLGVLVPGVPDHLQTHQMQVPIIWVLWILIIPYIQKKSGPFQKSKIEK